MKVLLHSSSFCSLWMSPPDLSKSLAILKDAHVLFSASNNRIASFSAKQWETWFQAVTKVLQNSCFQMFIFEFWSDCRPCKCFSTSWGDESHWCFHSECSRTVIWCIMRWCRWSGHANLFTNLASCWLNVLAASRIFYFQVFQRRVTFAGISNSSKLAF